MQLRERIWNNQFVNLTLKLKGSSELQDYCSGGGILYQGLNGTIETRPREDKTQIQNISQWTDAFIIFMSVYIVSHSQEAPNLLKYMYNIREAASKRAGFAWRSYDVQFQLRQEVSPASWAEINTDLWWRCTLSGDGVSASSSTETPRGQGVGASYPCLDYNKGACSWPTCRFSHTCSHCGGSHPASSCFKKQALPSARGHSFRFTSPSYRPRFIRGAHSGQIRSARPH